MTPSSPQARRSARRALLTAALAAAALPVAALATSPARAAANPGCATAGSTVTCTFSYNGTGPSDGTAISWPVPAGVTTLSVTADGASGAGPTTVCNEFACAGAGGEYQATLSAIPAGTTLSVFPGAAGSAGTGGVSQGGDGGSSLIGNGGGGASTVSVQGGSLLLVAGGGGGAGVNGFPGQVPSGGNGGTSTSPDGGSGAPVSVPLIFTGGNGGGGTDTAGGPGGSATGCPPGGNGISLNGGGGSAPLPPCISGPGGGSGYFGGGGGTGLLGNTGGAGGGSAFPAAATTVSGIKVTPVADSSTHNGNGTVVISYDALPPTRTSVSPVGRDGLALYGTPVQLRAAVTGSDGSGTVAFAVNGDPVSGCTAVPLNGHLFGTDIAVCWAVARPAGHDSVTATYSGDSTAAGSISSPVQVNVIRVLTGGR